MSDASAGLRALRYREEQLIRAPLAVVWEAAVDPMRQTMLQPQVHTVEVLTPGPLVPGSRYRMQAGMAGVNAPIDVEVLEMAPMRLITYRLEYPTQHFSTLDRCELAEVGGGVLLTSSSWFLEIGAMRLAVSRALRFVETRHVRRAMTRVATILEQG